MSIQQRVLSPSSEFSFLKAMTHTWAVSENLKQTQTIIINIIQYLQLIRQGFTEKGYSKSNSEGDGIRHEQKKKVSIIDADR